MRKFQLYDIVEAYKALEGQAERTVRFSTMAIRNRNAAMELLKDMEAVIAPGKECAEYERLRLGLLERLARRDEAGRPALVDTMVGGRPSKSYDMDDAAKAVFDKEIGELRGRFKAALEDRDKAVAEFNSMMEEECAEDIMARFAKVSEEHVPNLPVEVLAPWEPFIIYKQQ